LLINILPIVVVIPITSSANIPDTSILFKVFCCFNIEFDKNNSIIKLFLKDAKQNRID
jgi:hypothetical protein